MLRTSKRAAILVATLALGTLLSGTPAGAHGPDTAGWFQQLGDARGASTPVIPGLNVGTVLWSANRFTPPGTGSPSRNPTRYMAWGTKPVTGGAQLYVTRSGNAIDSGTNVDNNGGIVWQAPTPTTLRDPNGGPDLPFILNSVEAFDVAFTTFTDQPFMIWYRATGTTGTNAASIHSAFSQNGVDWVLNAPILEDGVGTLVGGAPYKTTVVGPSDVIYNAAGSTSNATCFAAASPFGTSCRYIMYYSTEDAAGNRYAAIARSGSGVTFRGGATPVLSPGGAGTWDEKTATNLTVQQVGSSFRALYSGSSGGASSIGYAESATGLTFTASASNPSMPNALFDGGALPTGMGSLAKAQFLADGIGHHTRVYTTRVRSTSSDAYLGVTTPAPGTAPEVLVSSPTSGDVIGPKVPVTIYAGDSLGTTPGLDLNLASVTIDGVGVAGLAFDGTIVGQYKLSGHKVSALPTLSSGAHQLVASFTDLDGETTEVTVDFTVDALAPVTTLTSAPTAPGFGVIGSAGRFTATVTDAAVSSGIDFVTAEVTNPLGQIKRYTTHSPGSWLITKTSDSNWSVSWVAPTLDPHFAVPGQYVFSLLGTDESGNAEKPATRNTAMVLVV